MTELVHLAKPLRGRRLRLKNRVVQAAILTQYAVDQRLSERLLAFYANRAAGGAALITVEPVNALPMQEARTHMRRMVDSGLWVATPGQEGTALQDPQPGEEED